MTDTEAWWVRPVGVVVVVGVGLYHLGGALLVGTVVLGLWVWSR